MRMCQHCDSNEIHTNASGSLECKGCATYLRATPAKPNGREFYGNPCVHCGDVTYTNSNDTYHSESGNTLCGRSN